MSLSLLVFESQSLAISHRALCSFYFLNAFMNFSLTYMTNGAIMYLTE